MLDYDCFTGCQAGFYSGNCRQTDEYCGETNEGLRDWIYISFIY